VAERLAGSVKRKLIKRRKKWEYRLIRPVFDVGSREEEAEQETLEKINRAGEQGWKVLPFQLPLRSHAILMEREVK